MDLKDIKAIIDLMKKNSVSEFELEKQDFKIRLKRGVTGNIGAVAYDDSTGVTYMQRRPPCRWQCRVRLRAPPLPPRR